MTTIHEAHKKVSKPQHQRLTADDILGAVVLISLIAALIFLPTLMGAAR